MNKLSMKKSLLIAMVATLGFSPGLTASETMNLNGVNNNYLQQIPVTYNGNTSTDFVGALTGSINGGLSQFFFCYDISHPINVPGSYMVDLFGPTASFPSYLGLPSTFNLQAAASMINAVNPASLSNVNQFAGLQLAIWSILYNWTPSSQSTSVNGPNFSASITGDTLTNAQNYLQIAADLVASGQYTDTGNLKLFVNANASEGNVTQTLVGLGVDVPEPSTYVILASALFMAAYLQRQRKAKAA